VCTSTGKQEHRGSKLKERLESASEMPLKKNIKTLGPMHLQGPERTTQGLVPGNTPEQ